MRTRRYKSQQSSTSEYKLAVNAITFLVFVLLAYLLICVSTAKTPTTNGFPSKEASQKHALRIHELAAIYSAIQVASGPE